MSTCSGRTGAGEITVAACESRCPADIFVDGDVHAGDLVILLGAWGAIWPHGTFDANVRTGDHFQAFHDLVAALMCARKLKWL